MTRERAYELRRIIEVASASLDDATALEAPELCAFWADGVAYAVGDRRRDRADMKLYKCVQAHTSQPDWNPASVPALWTPVAEPGEEWPEWRQPTGAQDAYRIGDKVSYDGRHWVCTSDYNTYAPDVYGWKEQ